MILPPQPELFDIPKEVAYLNCAYLSPIMRTVAEAGVEGVASKARPWRIAPDDFFSDSENLRASFAALIAASADDVAIVPSTSYGIAVAARNLPLEPGQHVLVLDEQFPSNIYAWRRKAQEAGAELRTIARGDAMRGGWPDWSAALIDAIGPDTAIVATANCHWTDGSLIDVAAVGRACRAHGAALVLDLTQSAGALPFDVGEAQPDFVACAAYKWLLGPYAIGFLYAAPHRQDGVPLEENWITRTGSENFRTLVDYQDEYVPGARRYDMGERSSFHLVPMAKAALDQLLEWGPANIAETLGATNAALAQRAAGLGFSTSPSELRAPHFLGLRAADGIPEDLAPRLAERNIFVSVRGQSIRVTPHLWNRPSDIERLLAALAELL